MTPDISIYSREFIRLACDARDAAQKLAIAVGYTDSDIGIPPVIVVRGEAIRIESGTVTGIGNPPVVELNLTEAGRTAEPAATAEDRGLTEPASGTPACPIDPTHDLEYCEGACEEVQRMAAEEPEPEPADDPPFVKGEPGPTPASAAFYMTAEELEQPAGGDNPWRLILHSDQPGYPVVRGRHPSLAAAFKAAGPTRDECTNKGWREVAPIRSEE